jgi:glycosyltransferase involved in cell wall biosynthesis
MNKKRVLYFVPEFPRLTETFIEREISQLVKFGVLDITVVSLNRASGYLSPRVEGVVHFHKLNLKHCLMSLRFLVLRPMQVLRAYALVFKASPTMIFRNTYLIAKAIGFASLFAEFKPDHIHAHFLSDPSTICMVVADLLGVPFSISGHARDVFVDGTFIPQKVVRAKFLSICNTYAWSKAVQLSGGMNSSNIHKIYHGMDLTFYLSSEPKMKKPDRPMIFAGSRLVEKKGLNYLIDASKILKDRGINHEVHIVGPGELYSKLVEQVHILGLENNVFIPGEGQGVSNAEIMEYFKVADIFAHPSVETGKGDVQGKQ